MARRNGGSASSSRARSGELPSAHTTDHAPASQVGLAKRGAIAPQGGRDWANGGHGGQRQAGQHEPGDGSDLSRSPDLARRKSGPLCGTLLSAGCRYVPKKSSCTTQPAYAAVCNASECSSTNEQRDEVSTTVAWAAHSSRRRMETPDQTMPFAVQPCTWANGGFPICRE
jgi:hypothetical protein